MKEEIADKREKETIIKLKIQVAATITQNIFIYHILL